MKSIQNDDFYRLSLGMIEGRNASLSLLSSKQIKFRNEHITYLSVIHDESTVEYIYLLSRTLLKQNIDD